ncbi:MAG: carbamoyltransferase C-terminal domain-containing protein [Pseudomonadota bacterium]
MKILGLVTKTHDTGAAIVVDGQPVAVMEEERFNRDKHTQLFPAAALDAALETAGLKLPDIDVVVTPWDVVQLRRSFREIVLGQVPASLNLLRPAAHAAQNSGIVFLHQRLRQGLRRHLNEKGAPDIPIVDVAHHDAHAAIYFMSPFETAAVAVMDGYGDLGATSTYIGTGDRLERQWSGGFFDSLGALYTSVTAYLGFKIFEEGTVMALAACGGSTFTDAFQKLVHFKDDGRFSLNAEYISFQTHGLVQPFTPRFYEEFGPARAHGEPLTDRHRDIAAALQHLAEDVVLHVVRALEPLTPSRNICITGGVALNCVANARVLRDTKFERVWVPPCASDTGATLGAALWHAHQTNGTPRWGVMTHPYFGKGYTASEIEAALDRAGLTWTELDDGALYAQVAEDLAAKRIVGWFQGRYEIGPRALGNRSILADPRDISIKDKLNAKIKEREPFRPFAPAVLAERAGDFFEISQPDPFMTLAPRVHPDRVADIPAAVHVDGTARIQTVDRDASPRFHALIKAFGDRTGVPVLLNTSFNRQEPVVASPDHAINCYLRTRMDVLVLNNHYVTDRSASAEQSAEAIFASQRAALAKRLVRWRQFLET